MNPVTDHGPRIPVVNKPHLYLLPGLLTDARVFQHQVATLSEIADVSVADLSNADSISALAAGALARAPAQRFALAGLSMGGYVALEIMRQAPERVLALALIDTSSRADTDLAVEGRQRLIHQAATDFERVVTDLSHKMVHPSQLSDATLMATIKGMALGLGMSVFLRQQKAIMGRIDSRPYLDAIHCPTLVLCGREDVVTPLALHEEMAAAIAGSRLVVVDQCGHLAPLGQPQRVSRAMAAWLYLASEAASTESLRADVS